MRIRGAGALALATIFLLGVGILGSTPAAPKPDIARQIRFGAEMARQGNWREAIFRWQRALTIDPDNPRLHNNLAVAFESLGEYDKAAEEYGKALTASDGPSQIRENHDQFAKFYARYKQAGAEPGQDTTPPGREPDAKAP